MSRWITQWLSGVVLSVAAFAAGCADQSAKAPHVFGQPVDRETMYFVYTENGKKYYASEEEAKFAQQQILHGANQPTAPQ